MKGIYSIYGGTHKKKAEPTKTLPSLFNNVIQALCGEGKVEEALLLRFLMFKHGKIPSRTSYDILIKTLDRLERFTDAYVVYGTALKQGVVPHRKPQHITLGKTCSINHVYFTGK